MSKKTIISKAVKFDSAVAETVVSRALELAQDIESTYPEGMTTEVAGALADEITEGKKSPRNSEWKAFAYAVQYGMVDALGEYPKTGANLTREKLFKLARYIRGRDYSQIKASVHAFIKDLEKAGKSKKSIPTLQSGLRVIKNVQTRKRNEIAFRKELVALCEKYNINY